MRRIQIKIWPEVRGYIPAIIPFDRIDTSKTNPIDIDFTNVSVVESASLNLILMKLLKISPFIQKRDWDLKFSNHWRANNKIIDLKFLELLNKNIPNNKIFLQDDYVKTNIKTADKYVDEITSYPIYEIDFPPNADRRNAIETFKDYLVENLQYLLPKYHLKVNKFIQILHEIAKNSADHTKEKAYFGMDIAITGKDLTIRFSLGDLGEGINQNVRAVIKNNPQYKKKHEHLAITDSYNYALSDGFTSKPYSLINRGIGMSTIFDLSKQINLELSVFDAESRGLLSSAKNISHVELRKIFYTVGFNVGFYYYGELKHDINQ